MIEFTSKKATGAAFYSLSAHFKIKDLNRRERGISTASIMVSLLLMKMSVSMTYFQFRLQEFVRQLAEEMQLLLQFDACCISAVISGYIIIQPVTRSHAFIILIF